jgi:hypothetical protein
MPSWLPGRRFEAKSSVRWASKMVQMSHQKQVPMPMGQSLRGLVGDL